MSLKSIMNSIQETRTLTTLQRKFKSLFTLCEKDTANASRIDKSLVQFIFPYLREDAVFHGQKVDLNLQCALIDFLCLMVEVNQDAKMAIIDNLAILLQRRDLPCMAYCFKTLLALMGTPEGVEALSKPLPITRKDKRSIVEHCLVNLKVALLKAANENKQNKMNELEADANNICMIQFSLEIIVKCADFDHLRKLIPIYVCKHGLHIFFSSDGRNTPGTTHSPAISYQWYKAGAAEISCIMAEYFKEKKRNGEPAIPKPQPVKQQPIERNKKKVEGEIDNIEQMMAYFQMAGVDGPSSSKASGSKK